ncbi:hypothetical protein HN51_054617, partial [Arachis hypogaea]
IIIINLFITRTSQQLGSIILSPASRRSSCVTPSWHHHADSVKKKQKPPATRRWFGRRRPSCFLALPSPPTRWSRRR